MIGRRGFLGTLLAGTALIALDPEKELWKPGKVISIGPRVHVPQIHQLAVHCTVRPGVYTALEDHVLFTAPAVIALRAEVDDLIAKAGGRRAEFLKMPTPLSDPYLGEYVRYGPQGNLPFVREIRAYDNRSREWVRSMQE